MKQSTIRKKEKQLLSLIKKAIEYTDDAVMITNANLSYPGPKIVYINPALCEMTGYSKKEFIGKSPRMLHGSRTDHMLLNEISKKLPKGELFHGHIINYRKDGSEMYMELDIAPVFGENSKITHYISIQRDITPVIKKTVEKNQLLDVFNHDIKTHLATVKGYLQLLAKKCSDTKLKQYITNSEDAVDKIPNLLNEIQNSTNPKAGGNGMRFANLDIDGVVAQTIKNVKVMSKSHKIARRGKVHQKLLIDASGISKVIELILLNAINDSTNTEKVIVKLSKDSKHVTISIASIRDFNEGITAEEIDKSLYTADTITRPVDINSKFGLYYFASKIVKTHGGIINVTNSFGKGYIFSIILPIRGNIAQVTQKNMYHYPQTKNTQTQ